jgi:hypothetical protein
MQIYANDGHFTDLLAPAKYRVMGHAGSAPCPPVTIEVQAGRTIDIPTIDCQGF